MLTLCAISRCHALALRHVRLCAQHFEVLCPEIQRHLLTAITRAERDDALRDAKCYLYAQEFRPWIKRSKLPNTLLH